MDEPFSLLNDESTLFHQLVKQTGEANFAVVYQMALEVSRLHFECVYRS